jgi:hypothetical protein
MTGYRQLLSLLAIAVLCNGCCCFPFLYPRTGAEGIVIDQHDKRIPNVSMQAYWVPASLWFVIMPPQSLHNFTADGEGRWKFHKMDAEHMFIEAAPPGGYESMGLKMRSVGPIQSGENRTNVILRLQRIAAPEQGK